jgi:hypothetical protein
MAVRYELENGGGVSESIGFLLIFTIVIAGIGLVTLYGYPLLMQQQVSADEKIMEKNMIVLQNDIKSLAYKTVPYKETSLKISGGTLRMINPSAGSTVQITASGYDSLPFEFGELRYESVSAQTDISLQNGAVAIRPRILPGSSMLAEPRWFYDAETKTMVISLIKIHSDENIAASGIGTVRMKLLGDPLVDETLTPNTITVTVTSPEYSVAWGNYLTSLGFSGGPSIYTFSPSPLPSKLVVKKYDIKIEDI